jgi:prepilin-type N-terminal cleavage/methylation domain-containing protein
MKRKGTQRGFSLIELLIAMTIMLVALGIVSTMLSRALAVRARESRTADALATAQAAISVLSREISNSGFGLYRNDGSKLASNGIVIAESNANRIRVLSNIDHSGGVVTDTDPLALRMETPGEDVTYFFDATTKSIVRYDAHGVETSPGVYGPQTSVVVNQISNVTFQYFDYTGGSSQAAGPNNAPTLDTARVRITVDVELDQVHGQPNTQHVVFASDVTLRNNNYMLTQY